MNDRITRSGLSFLLLTASFLVSGRTRKTYTDGKDYSKEMAPAPKPWCETPPEWEIRIGVPGWLTSVSGEPNG